MAIGISCSRWHEIDVGHRVVGQGGKCENIHGHRYRIEFHARALELNSVGMVIDFGVIKEKLCGWLDEKWDHGYLCYSKDPYAEQISALPLGIRIVDFNPTAENIAAFLLSKANDLLLTHNIFIWKVVVHETNKCSAEAVAK